MTTLSVSPESPPVDPRRASLSQQPIFDVRECRVCGCTEEDCECCISRTGTPCHWVEYDLCSACETSPPNHYKESAMSKIGDQIREVLTRFDEDHAKFEKGNHSAGVRARKALMEIKKIAGEGRVAINEAKTQKPQEEAA
jgi:hypothetical protein